MRNFKLNCSIAIKLGSESSINTLKLKIYLEKTALTAAELAHSSRVVPFHPMAKSSGLESTPVKSCQEKRG